MPALTSTLQPQHPTNIFENKFAHVNVIVMKEFLNQSPRKNKHSLVNIVPCVLNQYKLTGAVSLMGKEDFGQLLFHHFQGNGFDIWYSNFLLRKPVTLSATADDPLLEWHIPFVTGSMASGKVWGTSTSRSNSSKSFYVPFVNTRAEFPRGADYHSFDIHFKKNSSSLMPTIARNWRSSGKKWRKGNRRTCWTWSGSSPLIWCV